MKARKSAVQSSNKFSLSREFHYQAGIDVDVEHDYSHREGCDGNCYCSCSRISSTKINIDIQELAYSLATEFIKPAKNPILFYCIERILVHSSLKDADNFSVNIRSGYYGQEIDGVFFDGADKISKVINELINKKSDIERVKFALSYEYGYLIDRVRDAIVCELKDVLVEDLHTQQKDYFEKRLNRETIKSYLDRD